MDGGEGREGEEDGREGRDGEEGGADRRQMAHTVAVGEFRKEQEGQDQLVEDCNGAGFGAGVGATGAARAGAGTTSTSSSSSYTRRETNNDCTRISAWVRKQVFARGGREEVMSREREREGEGGRGGESGRDQRGEGERGRERMDRKDS